jgi:hypothetical protein
MTLTTLFCEIAILGGGGGGGNVNTNTHTMLKVINGPKKSIKAEKSL